MTTELTKAAQQDITERLRKDKWHITGVDAEEAAQLIEELREQLAKAKADERHIYEAYSRCADERSALTQRPAAQEVDQRAAFERAALAKWGPLDFERSEAVPEMYYNQRLDDAWIGFGFAVAWLRVSLPAPQQATPEPVGEVVAWQRRDRNIVTGEWSAWREDDDIEEELDPEWAERRPLFARPAPGVPEGFVLVPLKATPKVAMVLYEGARNCFSPKVAEGLWQDALAAAQAKAQEGE